MFLAALSQTIVATAMPRIITTWADSTATRGLRAYRSRSRSWGFFMIGSVQTYEPNDDPTHRVCAIQGIGGGIIMTTSFVAIADLFPPEERGKFQGLIGLVAWPRL